MPIINPMYLYLIEVLHNLDVLNQGVFVISSIITFMLIVVYPEAVTNGDDKIVKKYTCISGVVWLLSLIICVFVPTKDAMYKMLIASYVTTDNIQIVNEAVKINLQDYLNMLGEAVKNMK